MDYARPDSITSRGLGADATAVTVRGDGIVGCAAALALARLGLRVQWQALHRSAASASGATGGDATDVRTYALSDASVALLRRLRVWDALPASAVTPVRDMWIYGDAGSQLHFSAWQQGVEQLAFIVDAAVLEATLRQAVHYAPHIECAVVDSAPLPLRNDRLVVVCEGRDGAAREALGIRLQRHAYGHSGLATRLRAATPHAGVASQWFGSGEAGTEVVALLPFSQPAPGASYGLVWSLDTGRAHALAQCDEAEFLAELQRRVGVSVGPLELAGPRSVWPLSVGHAETVSGPGWVLLGDSAHTVHPLAGQGLNLGLGDVAALEAVVESREVWRPLGDSRLTARYARARAEAVQAMASVTDGLWHLFSNDHPVLRQLRNQGISMLNRFTPLKRALTRRAVGLGLAGLMAAAMPHGDVLAQGTAPAAVEAQLRKVLAERMPSMPKPDEVSRTPVPGLWELRFGGEIVYADEKGDFLIQGAIMDMRTRRDLTAERLDKLHAIQFATLPFKDAIQIKQGNGSRRLVVFSDPNCGYCKRFERELMGMKDVTLYTFLYPVLGKDSVEKARAIWCAADPAKAWRDWMVDGKMAPNPSGKCDDAALDRNTALGQRHRVESTPTLVVEDGTRRNGSLPLAEVERLFAAPGAAPKGPKS